MNNRLTVYSNKQIKVINTWLCYIYIEKLYDSFLKESVAIMNRYWIRDQSNQTLDNKEDIEPVNIKYYPPLPQEK